MPSLSYAICTAAFCAVLFTGVAHSEVETGRGCRGFAITSVRIFRAPGLPAIDEGTILLNGAEIRAVGTKQAVTVPRGYCRVDRPGASALAGFWNNHVHFTRPVLLTARRQTDEALEEELTNAFTKWGFTTVFDLASTVEIATAIRSRIDEGRVRGPRVLSVGDPFYPPDATPVYAREFYRQFNLPSAEISTSEEASARARKQLRLGMDGIKLFTGSIVGGDPDVIHMTANHVSALSNIARKFGRPVFAHPTDREGLEVAANNGVGILAHAAPLMGPWSPDYAAWLASRNVALIPTLALFAEANDPRTPVQIALQQTRALHAAGGAILFGTDVGFTDSFDTAAEMRLMQEAVGWEGLLASLTTLPAARFGEAERRGRIERGYIADIVIVSGDPRNDVAAMGKVADVVRSGKIIFSLR